MYTATWNPKNPKTWQIEDKNRNYHGKINELSKKERPSSIIQNIRKLKTLLKTVMKNALYDLRDLNIVENLVIEAISNLDENMKTTSSTKEESTVLKLADLVVKLKSILDKKRKEIKSMQVTQTYVIAKKISEILNNFEEKKTFLGKATGAKTEM